MCLQACLCCYKNVTWRPSRQDLSSQLVSYHGSLWAHPGHLIRVPLLTLQPRGDPLHSSKRWKTACPTPRPTPMCLLLCPNSDNIANTHLVPYSTGSTWRVGPSHIPTWEEEGSWQTHLIIQQTGVESRLWGHSCEQFWQGPNFLGPYLLVEEMDN